MTASESMPAEGSQSQAPSAAEVAGDGGSQSPPEPAASLVSSTNIPASSLSSTADGPASPLSGGRFMRDQHGLGPGQNRSPSSSPFRLSMPFISPGQLAFSAMQYLPIPLLVLNNLKTVVLANEAMGRMLGMGRNTGDGAIEDLSDVQDRLRGQSLSQVGIDMLQDGRPVWVSWEAFLDSIVHEMGIRHATCREQASKSQSHPRPREADATPTIHPTDSSASSRLGDPQSHQSPQRLVQDAVIEVVISRKDIGRSNYNATDKTMDEEYHIHAKMIITVWEVEDQQTYFNLTFTSSQSSPSMPAVQRKAIARTTTLDAADRKSISNSTPTSVASSRDSNSSNFRISPDAVSLSSSPFPPMGPPSKATHSSAPSILQKLIMMKDALLSTTQMPILAMWKDGSVTFPNKAARKLFRADDKLDSSLDGYDLLHNWNVYTEDFSRLLGVDEHPISVLLRTETPFSGQRIGMYDEDGKQVVFDVLGEAIRDNSTGEFVAGVVTCRDVTMFAQEISQIKEQDEERFRLICDSMPQLVWTTTADGMHDFFNTRWYHYTGLTPEDSMGLGWKNPFHPDDMPNTLRRWNHSLKTGEPYVTEYRCRSKDGEWKWFLGRALPLRNKQTGEIEKWFGTCTDVHEPMEAKLAAMRTQEQLLSVIAHSRVTLFTVDTNRRVTMLEGSLIWDATGENNTDNDDGSHWFIGQSMYEVFNRLNSDLPAGERPVFLKPIEDILNGRMTEDVLEHSIDGRWYRTRFIPQYGKASPAGMLKSDGSIEGVIGVIMDVTELKEREAALEEEAREKRQAMANEAAAKEANRLKSQFLANMSHEIRTPISGVLGMAEILSAELHDAEQREYLENIQKSATSLLTIINDILDFSKVESGRLDIEEVGFSLSSLVHDWSKWLRSEASRKDLEYDFEIDSELDNDVRVTGDPGRLRQILNNLGTNNMKFTSEGYIKFRVQKQRETEDVIEVRFTVQDSGIGIDDEMRKKLFQPFSQGDASTARRFGGTGLGLTICKNLLELMKGGITLESTGPRGTTATFWIPFAKRRGGGGALVPIDALPDRLQCEMSVSCTSSEYEQMVGTPPLGATEHSAFDKGKSPRRQKSLSTPPVNEEELPMAERANILVLVVEDNPINQKIATKFVTMLGFNVSALWNGKEALEYLQAAKEGKQPKPDIILMDVQMPVVDGYRCTHALRHHVPYKTFVRDVPIVAMTASAIQGDREKCTRAGMDDYLSKPVRSRTLEKMLVRWSISRRQTVSPLSDAIPASECSEASEYCVGSDLPHIDEDDGDNDGDDEFFPEIQSPNDPITPRPLTANGLLAGEQSPWSSTAGDFETSERRLAMRLRGDESASMPKDSSRDYVAPGPGAALTEENVGRLEKESEAAARR